jgi:hypothetical protein
MKKLFEIGETFVFYDEPLVFALRDETGGTYIGLLGDPDDGEPMYAALPVKPDLLVAFSGGKLDLLDAITNSFRGYWFGFENLLTASFEADIIYADNLPDAYTPAPGLVLETMEASHALIIEEATTRDRTIMHFALSDEKNRHTLSLRNLSAFSLAFQKVIENLYKKAVSALPNADALRGPENYELRAFGVSESSFNIHLEAGGMADIFDHESPIVNALEVFHEFITLGYDEDREGDLIDKLTVYKGHAISNLKKFLEQMLNRGIEVKYKWYSPGGAKVHQAVISLEYAKRVYDLLQQKNELVTTVRTFSGRVRSASNLSGKWALEDADEGIVKGRAGNVALLTGVEIDDLYRFTCEELIEEETVGGKEIKVYELTGKLKL